MKLRTTLVFLAACLWVLPAGAQNNPPPPGAQATPLGVHIGETSCADAAQRLRPTARHNRGNGLLVHTVEQPGRLYEGARRIAFMCESNSGPVLALVLVIGKGGMGSPAVAEAYRHLASKYRLVQGGRPPSLGDGHARFEAGRTVIDLEVKHLSFEFTISYIEKALHAQMIRDHQAESQQATDRRRGAL